MSLLISNQSLRGGEHFPQIWRELIGGAMITATMVIPIFLFAIYYGRDEFFKRVDGIFDRLEYWTEKQIVRRLHNQGPILPTSHPASAHMKRSASAPQISIIEYLSGVHSSAPLQPGSGQPAVASHRSVISSPTAKESFRINISPPLTPVYMTSDVNFNYSPKKETKQDV